MPPHDRGSAGVEALRKRLLEAILTADLTSARRLLQMSEAVLDSEGVVNELLEPVLAQVGTDWEQDKVSLAQGYVAAKVAGDVLERISAIRAADPARPPAVMKIAVLGNIEDDFHALGRKMVVTFLRSAGWQVHDLGNDVPAADFLQCAAQTGAKIIGVSAMTHTTASNIRQVRERIDAHGLKGRIQLAVGGAIFNLRPALVAEVGGDGSARNALAVPKLFETLWQRAAEAGR